MARTARVVFPSMPYHIISRGNNREPIFQEKEDFEKYLEICRRYKDRYEFKLYHWVREQLGRQGFGSRWIRRWLRLSDPEGEGQENSLYQFDISIKYEDRPEIRLKE